MGVDPQRCGCAAPTFDASFRDSQRGFDVPLRGFVQRQDLFEGNGLLRSRRLTSRWHWRRVLRGQPQRGADFETGRHCPRSPPGRSRLPTRECSRANGTALSRAMSSSLGSTSGKENRTAARSAKCTARAGMSSGRCRNGGRNIGNTARRYQRSSRKRPSAHHRRQVPVRGCHDPHIDVDRLPAAHPLEPAVLKNPQQANLRRQRQFADFVQEQGAAVGTLEPSRARFRGAGKRAPLMPEQLRVDQFRGNRSAIDSQERPAGSRRMGVNDPCNQLPCRSPFRPAAARSHPTA